MNYQMAVQFNFQQILQLVLQLSEKDRQELIALLQKKPTNPLQVLPLSKENSWQIHFKMKTAKQLLDKNYVYKTVPKHEIVGIWQGEESIDSLLALRSK